MWAIRFPFPLLLWLIVRFSGNLLKFLSCMNDYVRFLEEVEKVDQRFPSVFSVFVIICICIFMSTRVSLHLEQLGVFPLRAYL